MRISLIHISLGILLLTGPLAAANEAAGADASPQSVVPESGPAEIPPDRSVGEETFVPDELPRGPADMLQQVTSGAPQEILAADGTLLGTFTAIQAGSSGTSLNAIIRAKLDLARAAIATADRAGTRGLRIAERDEPAPELIERIKLERAAAQAPQPMETRPGVPQEAQAGSDRFEETQPERPSGPGSDEPQTAGAEEEGQ